MPEADPLGRLERIKKLIAADIAQPIVDGAGIIIPRGVDAAHRAAGARRVLEVLDAPNKRPDSGHNINEVSHG